MTIYLPSNYGPCNQSSQPGKYNRQPSGIIVPEKKVIIATDLEKVISQPGQPAETGLFAKLQEGNEVVLGRKLPGIMKDYGI